MQTYLCRHSREPMWLSMGLHLVMMQVQINVFSCLLVWLLPPTSTSLPISLSPYILAQISRQLVWWEVATPSSVWISSFSSGTQSLFIILLGSICASVFPWKLYSIFMKRGRALCVSCVFLICCCLFSLAYGALLSFCHLWSFWESWPIQQGSVYCHGTLGCISWFTHNLQWKFTLE